MADKLNFIQIIYISFAGRTSLLIPTLPHLSVSLVLEKCLRLRHSFSYGIISPIHEKFSFPETYSSYLVRHVIPLMCNG